MLRWLARPVVNEIERDRVRHGLVPLMGGLTASSGLAQIAQQPAFFDFPRKALPEKFTSQARGAPQLALLRRAALSITHAGLNTALESLSHGLPMVAIPITNDQPGVASRLEWLGVAEVVQPGKLSAARLRAAIETVLRDSRHRENALRRQEEIRNVNGPALAADIAEQAFTTRREVMRKI